MQRGTGWLVFLPTGSGRAVFQNSKPTGPVGSGVHVKTGRPVLGSTLSLGEAIFLFFAQANSQKCRFRYGSKNRPKTERPALFRIFAPKNVVICMSKQSEMMYHFFHEKSQNAAWSLAEQAVQVLDIMFKQESLVRPNFFFQNFKQCCWVDPLFFQDGLS